MRSAAATVDEYLAGLEPDRSETMAVVLEVVRAAMPPGYAEAVAFGMIGWAVPLKLYPMTYNKQPLVYAALASNRRYCSLYLMSLHGDPEQAQDFQRRWSAPRALDMGKSCVRFRTPADLDLPLIAESIAAVPVDRFIAAYELSRLAH